MPIPVLAVAPLLLAALQEPATSETVVTAARSSRTVSTPLSQVTVITEEELARTNARSLPRAIGEAAGILVQETNLGGGSPYLRGLVGNQVLIVVDGVRLNDATTRGGPNQALNGIDPATVERVEVVRGPSSVLYGSDALGGAILIWTKSRKPAALVPGVPTAEATGLSAALEAEYRSAVDGWRGVGELSYATPSDGFLGIGTLFDWEDLESADGEVDHTAYHGESWFGSWTHAFDPEHSLRVVGSRARDFDVPRTDRLNPGFGQTQPSDAEHEFSIQDRERFVVAYEDTAPGVLADSMQVRLSLRRYLEEREIRGLGSSTRRLEADQTETVGLSVDWRKALGDDHLLTFGFDADHDEVDSTRDDLDLNTGVLTPRDGAFAPDSRYLATGVFVQDEIVAFDPVMITAGLRYSYFDFAFDDFTTGERVDGDFDALTASLQASRPLSESASVTATLAQGFRAPNLADLAKNGSTFGGTELANPDLDPERSWTAELALDYVRPLWWAALAVYYNEIDDAIGSRLIDPGAPPPGDETFQRDNVGELRYAGVELSGRRRLGEDSPWSVGGNVEAIYGRQFDDTVDPNTGGTPLDDVPARRLPPIHGRLALAFEPARTWHRIGWVELAYVWAFEQDELNPGDEGDPRIDPDGTEAWNRVDLDVGGPIGAPTSGSTWHVGLHNLFDESYRVHGSGFDAAGFGVVAGVRVSL